MKKTLQNLLAVTLLFIGITANSQNRYLDEVFTDVYVSEIDTFALNVSIEPMLFGLPPALLPIECDIYQPIGDVLTNRPVIIVSHTGSFLPPVANGQPTGSIKDSSIVEQCMRWAKKGYVAVAMGNRKGWNPISTDQNVRTSTLLQAAYRGIQDAKAMVRFMRMTEATLGNPFGIDPNKIVLGGHGTGAYIALGYATLDNAGVELNLPKFIDFSNPSAPAPYVVPYFFGNIDGTDLTFAPLYDTLGNLIPILDTAGNLLGFQVDSTMPLNIPNHPQYSNDINMAFNLGGALADISWLEDGDVPIVSFHCANDPYAPIDTGDVIVPTTGDFVVEVMGSRTVQHYSNQYGNNDAFINAGFSFNGDPFTVAANVNNSGYEGLNVFVTPSPSTTPNAFGEMEEEQGAPWDWWDNTTYDQMFQAVNGAPPGYGAANSLLGNPDMSAAKGRAYIDTIQGYLNPRIYVVLNLGGALSVNNVVDYSTNIFPNPAKNNITITNSNFVINSVEIYNIAGQLVKSENVNSMKANLNVSNLDKGIYILEISSDKTSIKRKLIVE
ncbi:MAG: T9SS type A sorting domain-containing protein [Flavobacteriales bacterium]|nr:T9SS type A sorting domain-containing protein [Flavobacteriales bacterium]